MGRVGVAVVGALALGCAGDEPGAAAESSGTTSVQVDDGREDASSSASVDDTRGTSAVDASTSSGGSTDDSDTGAHESSSGGPVVAPPPYPIVLAHGFFGFQTLAGIEDLTYFFGVVDHFAARGEIVYTPAVDPFNDSTVRGEQLLAAVEAIVADTGCGKVNLVGHSQGGLDARVVAHLRPDLVASVTTLATPHAGTPVADVVLGLTPNDDAQVLLDALVNFIGAPLWDELGEETSLAASMYQMSSPGIAEFEAMYPDADGVAYYSIAGRSGYHDGGAACMLDDAPEFVAAFAEDIDAIEPLLAVPFAVVSADVFDPVPNDGLVPVESARHGRFLGCIPADHFDEVGQLVGDTPGLTNPWLHLEFYAALATFLRAEGL